MGPPDLVDLVLEDPRWESAGLGPLAERAARAALAAAGVDPEGYEIALLACADARIAVLNAEFRGKPAPTNVLSWPAHELSPDAPGRTPFPPPEPGEDFPEGLGDIAIAYDTAAAEAEAAGIPLGDHAFHLVLHATLHLLGYDHETEADAALMEGIETRTLVSLGYADPYSRSEAAAAVPDGQEP